ncbi:MAG: rhodanese-like domain-containing protein [Eubacteriales bacterium]|nr:rhodanese-like domain-containing protein [Eubacteriales bacterium]
MKHLLLLVACLLSALVLLGCAPSVKVEQGADNTAYHKITAEEAKKMMDEGDVIVVDVRRAEEYEQKHIPGAILAPNETIAEDAAAILPDKDATLLVHCRTGIRSKQASDKLVKLGYTKVYDMGGIVDWPYETESGAYEPLQ